MSRLLLADIGKVQCQSGGTVIQLGSCFGGWFLEYDEFAHSLRARKTSNAHNLEGGFW